MRITVDIKDNVVKHLMAEILKEAAGQKFAGLPYTCSQMLAYLICEGLEAKSDCVEIAFAKKK